MVRSEQKNVDIIPNDAGISLGFQDLSSEAVAAK